MSLPQPKPSSSQGPLESGEWREGPGNLFSGSLAAQTSRFFSIWKARLLPEDSQADLHGLIVDSDLRWQKVESGHRLNA